MVIEQTVEIPADHRLVLDLPLELPPGTAKVEVTIPDPAADKRKPLAPQEALVKLFGCCANSGDTMDAYMERHWADNDLERAIELSREMEREQYREKKNLQ
jgi:hypothetical protein